MTAGPAQLPPPGHPGLDTVGQVLARTGDHGPQAQLALTTTAGQALETASSGFA